MSQYYVKLGEHPDQLSDCQILKKDPDAIMILLSSLGVVTLKQRVTAAVSIAGHVTFLNSQSPCSAAFDIHLVSPGSPAGIGYRLVCHDRYRSVTKCEAAGEV
jgi:hypothetical protein